MHVGILNNYVEALLDGTPLLAPGEEGINGLTISNAAYLSSWENRWVDLPLDEDRYYELLSQRIAGSKHKENVNEATASTEGTYGAK